MDAGEYCTLLGRITTRREQGAGRRAKGAERRAKGARVVGPVRVSYILLTAVLVQYVRGPTKRKVRWKVEVEVAAASSPSPASSSARTVW